MRKMEELVEVEVEMVVKEMMQKVEELIEVEVEMVVVLVEDLVGTEMVVELVEAKMVVV